MVETVIIDPKITDVLRGIVSEPITTPSYKGTDNGKLVTVRVALENPCMAGLVDWQDNKEWWGINHHCLLCARGAVHYAQPLSEAGLDINSQNLLDTMRVSHAGRRQWDEAGWYPDAAPDAAYKKSHSNETLGLRLIHGKVPKRVFELVAALAHNLEEFSVNPAVYDSWNYKLAIYVDHRTTNKYEELYTRMSVFLLGNFYTKDQVTPDKKDEVYNAIDELIRKRQKNFRPGLTGGDGVLTDDVLDLADRTAEKLGASPNSPRLLRKDLMRLILEDADTESRLIEVGIDPSQLSEDNLPMPDWEDELRRQYVADAADSIYEHMSMDSDFPPDTLWGHYARRVHDKKRDITGAS